MNDGPYTVAGAELRDQIAAVGCTPLGFARAIGVTPLLLEKRIVGVSADGTGLLDADSEARIAAGLVALSTTAGNESP